ncbi:hypothetical protein XENOCAPTIV_001343 [Xenoophorus captivus]|uniref:Uncharacterized protein n=1 Tax=Xenoophorus captivus TaxID=1517983 RepID=A0ABV0QH00_9TELE
MHLENDLNNKPCISMLYYLLKDRTLFMLWLLHVIYISSHKYHIHPFLARPLCYILEPIVAHESKRLPTLALDLDSADPIGFLWDSGLGKVQYSRFIAAVP